MITTAFLMMFIFVVCDALQDVITYNFDTSVFRNTNRKYFDPRISWKNKYKDCNPNKGERFFGSTTFLVWLTDFWHLLKFIKMNIVWIALAVALGIWWIYLAGMLFHGIIFELSYRITK